jgi:hypothetical protein
MTEVLYAGNQVIAGSWLPYGFFRRSKIAFYEVDNFLELPNVVAVMVQENEKLKINKNLNKENIRNYFFPSQTTPDWINLFETVSNYNK